MSRPGQPSRPIIIRRGEEGKGHGHHGGAWKVAYADFVTAMMAFFLLLWLVGSADKDTLKGLAEFFSDAKVNTGPPGGAGGVLEGFALSPDPLPSPPANPFEDMPPPNPMTAAEDLALLGGLAEDGLSNDAKPDGAELQGQSAGAAQERQGFDAAQATIEAALETVPELRALRDSLVVDQTREGLRIQLVDLEQVAMFPIGSDAMYPHTRRLLEVVVTAIRRVPNRVSIRGHTDALPFAPGATYDNWALSSDRANATRRTMVELGLSPARIAEVVGKGDAEPLLPDKADDPRNRRISIVLLRDGTR